MPDDMPLDEAGQAVLTRIRRIMFVSLGFTFLALAIVLAIIGYRVSRGDGSPARAADMTATLPKGSRVVQTAVSEDRIVVTIEAGGAIEIRTFDVRTLRPVGRLGFAVEP